MMKVKLSNPIGLEVNNERMIRIRQNALNGPITVRVLSAPYDAFGSSSLETMFEISPGDMVTMLNWYRYQKENGNEDLSF